MIYQPGTKVTDRLAEYAKYFPFVELNFTYHRMPAARMVEAMVQRAPGMRFSVKASPCFTHARNAGAEDFAEYRAGIAPLLQADVLLAVLLQFPHSFHLSAKHLAWIKYVGEGLQGLPLVIEFRSHEWMDSRARLLLEGLNIGWCAVDQPRLEGLMPPKAALTSQVAYVRFHGRNGTHWWEHEESWERHDYLYPASELAEWMHQIEHMVESVPNTVLVFDNVCWGQGIENAQMLTDMLPDHLKAHAVLLDPPLWISTVASRPAGIAAHYARREAARRKKSGEGPGSTGSDGGPGGSQLGLDID
ncbi:MAG: DUF72 domain-containing protein [bacterium]